MYSDKELAKLISEVETEFSSYLAKAETTLSKSEDDALAADKKDKKPEAKKEDSEKAPAKDKAPVAHEAPEVESEEAAPAEEEEVTEAPADEAELQDAASDDEGHGYDEDDMAAMTEMYASMSRPELIAHHDAVKAALDAMGTQDADVPPQETPDAPAAPAAAPMMKSETDVVVEVPASVVVANAETEILKSELASKDGEITELKKNVEVLTTFVNKLFEKKSAPAGKAITALETIKKNEDGNSEDTKTLTKGEITKRLSDKASDPTLKKSDREAINAFYASGQINLNGISHLLK